MDACKCFGSIPFTTTAHATTTTVTVTAANAITTTVSTLTTTQTNTAPVTATTSVTLRPTVDVIETVITTETITESSTLTVLTTTTPTVVATQTCKLPGTAFRATMQLNGHTLYLGSPDGFSLSWDYYADPNDLGSLKLTTFMLADDGYLALENQELDEESLFTHIDVSIPTITEQIYIGSIGAISHAENFKQVSGCIYPTTGVLSLSAAGRGDLLECEGAAKLSRDAGSDDVDCVVVAPETEYFI